MEKTKMGKCPIKCTPGIHLNITFEDGKKKTAVVSPMHGKKKRKNIYPVILSPVVPVNNKNEILIWEKDKWFYQILGSEEREVVMVELMNATTKMD